MKKQYLIPKEELYQKYIVENLSRKECASFFNAPEGAIVRRLIEYKIKRDPKMTYKNREKAMLEKYGVVHPSQSEEFKNKVKATMINRYGVEYTAQSEELRKKMQKTMMNRYNKKNYVETSEFKDKVIDTCLEKYGVDYPCLKKECIKALEESVGHSKPEKEFSNLLDKYNIKYEQEFPIRSFKYDFKVDNMLFEINPSGTHNVTFGLFGKKPKDRMYHFIKYSVAKEYGFRCVHVFDWDDKEKIIKLFLLNKERVYARECVIKEVNLEDTKKFLNENHLQGYAKDKIRLGLYYDNELVEIMTFDKPRYNKNYDYELVRLCSIKKVVGGTKKLFNYFLNNYNPMNVISYCDLSKFDGNIYKDLGFKVINKPHPSKHWINLRNERHITDNLLRQKGFDKLFKTNYGKGTSNEELMRENGFVEVYDCGQLSFVFKK